MMPPKQIYRYIFLKTGLIKIYPFDTELIKQPIH